MFLHDSGRLLWSALNLYIPGDKLYVQHAKTHSNPVQYLFAETLTSWKAVESSGGHLEN